MDPTQSGMTIDGVAVPLAVEAEGADAIDAHVLEQLTAPATPAPDPATAAAAPAPTDEDLDG